MNPDRAIAAILTTSLLAVLGLGIWLLWDAGHRAPAAPPTPTPAPPTATPVAPAGTAPVTPPAAAATHRLAGTVVGGLRFAIIEDADGGNTLYRPGETIPGLGELIEIGEDRITLAGSDGRFEMRLAPAPTATVTATPAASATVVPPTRTRRRSPARSAFESSP